jgi:uncharacterized protein (TIGR03435 family)
MVNCINASLRQLLEQAYNVKSYQIEGPSWLDSDGYNVMARVPQGVPASQVPVMFQALLAERFQVNLHRETRTLPAYELNIAKDGPKLKEVDPGEVAAYRATHEAARAGREAPTSVPATGGRGRGASTTAGARPMAMGTMAVRVSQGGGRTDHFKMSMPDFANFLSNQLSRPVVDQTALTGVYDIELTYLADESDPLQMQLRQAMAAAGAIGRADSTSPTTDADASSPIPTLFQALQQTLGLKLNSKKAPVEILVIESANRVPTQN